MGWSTFMTKRHEAHFSLSPKGKRYIHAEIFLIWKHCVMNVVDRFRINVFNINQTTQFLCDVLQRSLLNSTSLLQWATLLVILSTVQLRNYLSYNTSHMTQLLEIIEYTYKNISFLPTNSDFTFNIRVANTSSTCSLWTAGSSIS